MLRLARVRKLGLEDSSLSIKSRWMKSNYRYVQREFKTRDGGHAIMVPKLCENHIYHQRFIDITPAKIMQVCKKMHKHCASCCTLFVTRVSFDQHITNDPAPDDTASAHCTHSPCFLQDENLQVK